MFDLISYGPLAPPVVFIWLVPVGMLLALVWRRVGLAIALTASLCLYALATPALSSWLMRRAEAGLPENPDFAGAQAIIVLGGDMRLGSDGAPDTLGPYTTERISYAARAYRQLHLPVAVSGGPAERSHANVGDLMKAALVEDFGIPVRWDENRSGTTWENAADTKPLLDEAGIKSVVLVTHAWHMSRSIWCFERVGLHAVPWPAPRSARKVSEVADFLPRSGALQNSFYALHELIGGFYYRIRH